MAYVVALFVTTTILALVWVLRWIDHKISDLWDSED